LAFTVLLSSACDRSTQLELKFAAFEALHQPPAVADRVADVRGNHASSEPVKNLLRLMLFQSDELLFDHALLCR
jgi:hypothetical protein